MKILLLALMLAETAQAAVVVWSNTSGGLWSAATNWSGGAVPAVGDTVAITNAGDYVVTQDVHVAVAGLVLGGPAGVQTLMNSGANLTLNGPGTIGSHGVFGFSGGMLAGTGSLQVNGALSWAGGTIAAPVNIATNGVLAISGSVTRYLSGTGALNNQGTMVWSGTNNIQTGNVTQIINQTGALFDIQNDQSLYMYNGGVITNFGILRKSAGGGTTSITVPLCNYGILVVQSGQVDYGSGCVFNDGSAFTGAGVNRVYTGAVAFNGAVASENLEIAGAIVGGNGVFSGAVNWTSGVLNSGSMTIATNGTLAISGSETKHVSGSGVLINEGVIVWSGTNDIQTGNSARIINQSGALFDIQNNQSLWIYNGGVITNFGTLRKSAGSGTTSITVPLRNYGILDVQSGQVDYGTGCQFNDGTAFTGAGVNRVYTGTITFGGAITSENLEIAGATVGGNGVFSGAVNWTGGVLNSGSMTIATNGTLSITGSETKYLTGTGALINQGVIAWSGTNNIQTGNSARFINQAGALFDIQNDQSLWIYNGGVITNFGTLRKSGGSGTTSINVPMNNLGTVDVQRGAIAFHNYTQTGGKLSFGLGSPSDFGRLAFEYSIAFTGTLDVNLIGGYVPVAGDSFALISYPSRTGAFTDLDLPASNAWQTNYAPAVMTLTVLNTRPTLSPISDKTTDEQIALGFTVTGSDPDAGQAVTYALLAAPGGATINTNSGAFAWTPTEAQGPSTNAITVAVTDNGLPPLSDTNSFTVVVREANTAPVLAAIPDLMAIQDVPLLYTNAATDADIPANVLAYELVAGPTGMWVDTNSGVLHWTPSAGPFPYTNLVTVRVSDSGAPKLSDEKSFSIVAQPRPLLTIAKSGPNVILSWPAYASGFGLQWAADLEAPSAWWDMTNLVVIQGGTNRVTTPADSVWRCYRLRYGSPEPLTSEATFYRLHRP